MNLSPWTTFSLAFQFAKDGSAYRGRDDGTNYLTHTGPAPPASVGGSSRPRPASPDPKTGVSRPRSASPNAAAASAAAVVAAAVSLPHQTLEHAMQTKLTLGAYVYEVPLPSPIFLTASERKNLDLDTEQTWRSGAI